MKRIAVSDCSERAVSTSLRTVLRTSSGIVPSIINASSFDTLEVLRWWGTAVSPNLTP